MENKHLNDYEIKRIEFKILKSIHDICMTNNINYSLAGGTLLGAIRHKGFIPWDDDVDILMTRENYERFVDYCTKNETAFNFLCCTASNEYGQPFAKACDKNTYLIEENVIRGNYTEGIYVDIFPIDYIGDSVEEAKRAYAKRRFKSELLVAANWGKFIKSKTHGIIYEPFRLAFFIISRFINPNKLARSIESKNAKNKDTNRKYSGCFYGSYREKEILKSEIYEKTIMGEFEGEKFLILENYDEYLNCLYGDYMKLPPIEKQKTHHGFTAYKKV